ncbi:MAG: amidohydrolase family protein [Gemmatimonadota bacterium]|nr:amidohydrolase family protein [Gemmatimonadota bacterium]
MVASLRRAAVTATAVTLAVAPLSAQLASPRNIPATYAITNARLVTIAGPAIEKGTVVVRDGLIAAVGAGVTVPADARVIDGTGLTVYPGLIDAYGTLGVPNAPAPGAGGGGRGGAGGAGGPAATPGRSAPNSNYPAGLQPEQSVVDLLKADDEAFSGPTGAGITTALTGTGAGIFQGQSAIINLAGSDVNAMVVKAPVAQHIGFSPLRNGGFPNSLMGVFAALRQQFLDAQHYRDVKAAYERNPRGMTRPAFDPSLEALLPVLARTQPVVMYATTQREIERALDLAKEFGLRPIIAGGNEAHLVAARLKADNVPVLLSLNFPRRNSAASADADPDPIRVLRERADAPKAAGKLAAAGVKFAFISGGLSTWSDVTGNAQKTVEHGLSGDAALRAFTLQSAEILGVGDRLGSLETGKIANLVVTRGDLLDRGRVTQLFIDGRPVALRAPTTNANAAAGITGTWTVTVSIDGSDLPTTWSLRQDGTRLLGSMQGALGSVEIQNGTIGADNELRFTASITMKDGTEEATFVGTLDGNAIRGRMAVTGHAPSTFSGTRPQRQGGPPAGNGATGNPPAGGAPRTPPEVR